MRKFAPYGLIALMSIFSGCDTDRTMENPDVQYFIKYYGGDGDQKAVDMEVLPDGSFLLLGTYAASTVDSDVYLLRVSSLGDIIWEVRHGEDQNVLWNARDLALTQDGNLIVLADYRAAVGADSDFSLLKFSLDGALLDEILVTHSSANEYVRSVTPLSDGGFMVVGMTEKTATFEVIGHPDRDLGDVLNYRFDANLDIDPVWQPVAVGFGSHLDVAVKAVSSLTGYYVFGYTDSNIGGNNPLGKKGLFYVNRQPLGTTAELLYVPGLQANSDTEIAFVDSVDPKLGGGTIIIGSSTDNSGVSEIYLAHMRPSLNFTPQDLSFSRILSLNRNVKGVSVSSASVYERGYLVLGNEIRSTGASNIWLSKTDLNGRVLWSTTLGSEGENDTGAIARELPDGKIAILGTVELAENQFVMALYKVNKSGRFMK